MSQQDEYQWLFRRSPALLVSLNEDGFFVDASDAWLRRFGYAREEITNMRPQDLASPDGAKRIVDEYMPVLRRTGSLAGVPIDLVTRNNERVDCLAHAIVERSEAGDAAHRGPPRPHHQRQRSLARNTRLSPRRGARTRDHRVHGQGDSSHARRAARGRDRGRRARERAAHLRHEVRGRGRGGGL